MDNHNMDEVTRPETSASLSPDEWSLSRVEIRSPNTLGSLPLAWVELVHPVRGKVSDISKGPTTLDAVFAAAGQILNLSPRLASFDVRSTSNAQGGSLALHVELEIELAGAFYTGVAFGVDLVGSALRAWLDACSAKVLSTRRAAPISRPFQVMGVDENDDLWVFASADEGAAEALFKEFEGEEFVEIRRLNRLPSAP